MHLLTLREVLQERDELWSQFSAGQSKKKEKKQNKKCKSCNYAAEFLPAAGSLKSLKARPQSDFRSPKGSLVK